MDYRISNRAAGVRPLEAAPDPPPHLSADEAALWRETAAVLVERGALTSGDVFALERLVVNAAALRELRRIVGAEGLTLPDRAGAVKKHPLLTVLNTLSRTVLDLEREFGLTPRARKRLRLPTAAQPDELQRFLGRQRAGGFRLARATKEDETA